MLDAFHLIGRDALAACCQSPSPCRSLAGTARKAFIHSCVGLPSTGTPALPCPSGSTPPLRFTICLLYPDSYDIMTSH
jgi:hypothetical protein